MGIIYDTVKVANPWRYEREYNADGTEKHITCDGARYHVLSYAFGIDACTVKCSEPNCEINRQVKNEQR